MTQTLQGALQQAIRDITGKSSQDFNGDLHDLCSYYGIPDAPISGRVIALVQLFDSTVTTASSALNYLLQNPPSPTPPAGNINVLNSTGTSYSVPLAILTSTGASYTVTDSVLSSNGTAYTV